MADIPAMAITTLNGAGWVFLSLWVNFYNASGGNYSPTFQLLMDGVLIPHAIISQTPPTGRYGSISFTIPIKPGAGNHTYKAQACADIVGYNIAGYSAHLIMDEPGY